MVIMILAISLILLGFLGLYSINKRLDKERNTLYEKQYIDAVNRINNGINNGRPIQAYESTIEFARDRAEYLRSKGYTKQKIEALGKLNN